MWSLIIEIDHRLIEAHGIYIKNNLVIGCLIYIVDCLGKLLVNIEQQSLHGQVMLAPLFNIKLVFCAIYVWMDYSLIKLNCWWLERKVRGEFDEACPHFLLKFSVKEEKPPCEITNLFYTNLSFNSWLVDFIQLGVYDLLSWFNAINRSIGKLVSILVAIISNIIILLLKLKIVIVFIFIFLIIVRPAHLIYVFSFIYYK